jgi:acetylserotonin N-methyltransferase
MLLEDSKDRPGTTAAFSMLMMLRTKGKQFTASELENLLLIFEFQNVVITPSFGYFWLISAQKP